jgi:hypothetical protein
VTAIATITSPVAMRGNQWRFCASVPPRTSARVRISGRVMSDPPMPSDAREIGKPEKRPAHEPPGDDDARKDECGRSARPMGDGRRELLGGVAEAASVRLWHRAVLHSPGL